MSNDPFLDFYELMQISPKAEPETVQRVYRMLAARYHPDNPRTGDPDRFIKLRQAYEVLSNEETRAAYDVQYQLRMSQPMTVFEMQEFAAGIDGEANRRMGILCLLYNRRRTSSDYPGMSILEFENLMSLPREHLMFTIWYLKDAEFVRQDENSNLVITSRGVDYVEKNLSAHHSLYDLLKSAEAGSVERSKVEGETPPDGAANK
ncbi:MAG TPA: J domain-containing protein [Bryobacteraceae bacterium]|nr:J domain-containing protein [Bryobacteraceae bacterium]